MSAKTLLAAASLLCIQLLVPTDARAALSDTLGEWEGTGSAAAISGKDLGDFKVVLTRKSIGAGKVRADGRVTLASGQQVVFWQEFLETEGRGFRLVTNQGSGGGRCFANGMCQSYEERADGHAFATTVVHDGFGKLRVLVTELDQGKATRFFQQTLSKRQ